jgi:ABC-type polysaccharide/polyol phosphate export permease
VTGYFSDIWRLRHFWMALVRIDLRKRYRRSVIGIGWSLLHPIAMTAVLCIVFSQLLNQDIRTFAPFLLSGLTFWGFILATVMEGCQCFLQGESYIRQQPAPLAIYPLRSTLGAGFHFLLGFAIVLAFVWWTHTFANPPQSRACVEVKGVVAGFNYNSKGCAESLLLNCDGKLVQMNFPRHAAAAVSHAVAVHSQIAAAGVAEEQEGNHAVYQISRLAVNGQELSFAQSVAKPQRATKLPILLTLLPTLVLLFIVGWSLAVCMGLANVMFQDSQHLIQIVMQIAFYVTPIMYPPELLMGRRLVSWFVRLNPLAAFLELIRKPILDGELPSTWAIAVACAATVIVVLAAALGLKRFEKRLIFYL